MPTSRAQRSWGEATCGAGFGAAFGLGDGLGEERLGSVGTGPGTAPPEPLDAKDAAMPTTATFASRTAPTRTRRHASTPTSAPDPSAPDPSAPDPSAPDPS